MEVLVTILTVAVLIEVIVFSGWQVHQINKRIDSITKIFDIQFRILEVIKSKVKGIDDDILHVAEGLDATQDVLQNSMDVHDRFVDFVKEKCIMKKEKITKEAKKKSKRGRPKKDTK